jgi:hypothetical protein
MTLQFEPIELERQHDYAKLLAQCPQVASDYSFFNLWAWAEDFGLQWAWDDKLIWIKQTYPETVFWAPVGPWETVDWKKWFGNGNSRRLRFIRVPEKLADIWRKNMGDLAAIAEERGHWDYLYQVVDLIELKGNRYHKKKNLLNQFKKKYDYVYVPLESELVGLAIGMQTDWCTWRDCESSDILSAENRAIYKILQQWDRLEGTIGGAIMVDQKMAAYTVAETLTDDTVLIHFEKGDTEYKGVYQAINQMFLENSAADYRYVNREQDLNDEGLRKAKLSYLPVEFLQKYRVDLPATFNG